MLVERNYRVARGPHARGGEIDLILRERNGTLVFVEVRSRADARHYLLRFAAAPACRFDVVAIDAGAVQ